MLVATVPVVKDHETGVITFPPESVAPLTVAVYVVDVRRGAFGLNVAVTLGPSYVTVPATLTLLGSLRTKLIDADVTGSLKVALMLAFGATFVAFAAGVLLVIVGGPVLLELWL